MKFAYVRGLKALAHDAVDATVELVREGHTSVGRSIQTVASRAGTVGDAVIKVDRIREKTAGGVLDAVSGVNRLVERVSDVGIELLVNDENDDSASAAPPQDPGRVAGVLISALNVGVGDHLHARANPLNTAMTLHIGEHRVGVDATDAALDAACAEASAHIVVLVHGLGLDDRSWRVDEARRARGEVDLGVHLADVFGWTPVYLRYNTGRRISDNGHDLASMLDRIHTRSGATGLTLIGHSMGVLVLHSACHQAEARALAWADDVQHVFTLGSPHQGAPLAKLGDLLTHTLSAIDVPATRIIGNILAARSAGVRDLTHGAILEEAHDASDHQPVDDLPVPHALHCFVAGVIGPPETVGRVLGDMVVRSPSAKGPVTRTQRFALHFEHDGFSHVRLQRDPAVWAHIHETLRDAQRSE